jgi:hypothetical protein
MILDVHPGSGFFFPSRILDQGVKKALDPGSGSATLPQSLPFFRCVCYTDSKPYTDGLDGLIGTTSRHPLLFTVPPCVFVGGGGVILSGIGEPFKPCTSKDFSCMKALILF